MSSHALLRGRNLRPVAVAFAVLSLTATTPPALATTPVPVTTDDPTSKTASDRLLSDQHPTGEHNARVAEYLLLQDLAPSRYNAQVAEHFTNTP